MHTHTYKHTPTHIHRGETHPQKEESTRFENSGYARKNIRECALRDVQQRIHRIDCVVPKSRSTQTHTCIDVCVCKRER